MDGNGEIVSVRLADGSYENQNTGRTSHKGIEANIRYAPVEELTVRLSASYAVHRYIDYVQQGKDFSGNRMAQAPNWIGNGEITYKPHFLKGFRIAAEMQGMSSYYTDPQNSAVYKGFLMYNMRAGYAFGKMELWVNCINLTDKVFATTVEKNAYGTSYRPGQLRSINAGLAYNFSSK